LQRRASQRLELPSQVLWTIDAGEVLLRQAKTAHKARHLRLGRQLRDKLGQAFPDLADSTGAANKGNTVNVGRLKGMRPTMRLPSCASTITLLRCPINRFSLALDISFCVSIIR
jgi:hypothetical protein